MVLEPAGGLAGGEVPQPQSLVPGARQSKVSIRGKNLGVGRVNLIALSSIRKMVHRAGETNILTTSEMKWP